MYSTERTDLPSEIVSQTEIEIETTGDLYGDTQQQDELENSVYNLNLILDAE